MAKFTRDMKTVFEKSKPFIVATATRDGKPNGVPVGLAKVYSDDELMVVDVLMHKTRKNLEENPMIAVTAWDLGVHYGYQFKGKARVETSGKRFNEAVEWCKKRAPDMTVNAVLMVKVEEVYYIGMGKDPSKNLFK